MVIKNKLMILADEGKGNTRMIAEYFLNHWDDIGNLMLKEMSSKMCISQRTLSRFFVKIGCKDFSTFKACVLREINDTGDEQDYDADALLCSDNILDLADEVIRSVEHASNLARADFPALEMLRVSNILFDSRIVGIYVSEDHFRSIAYKYEAVLKEIGVNAYAMNSEKERVILPELLSEEDSLFIIGSHESIVNDTAMFERLIEENVSIVSLTDRSIKEFVNVDEELILPDYFGDFNVGRRFMTGIGINYYMDVLTLFMHGLSE